LLGKFAKSGYSQNPSRLILSTLKLVQSMEFKSAWCSCCNLLLKIRLYKFNLCSVKCKQSICVVLADVYIECTTPNGNPHITHVLNSTPFPQTKDVIRNFLLELSVTCTSKTVEWKFWHPSMVSLSERIVDNPNAFLRSFLFNLVHEFD
jgi:hypothetical protein